MSKKDIQKQEIQPVKQDIVLVSQEKIVVNKENKMAIENQEQKQEIQDMSPFHAPVCEICGSSQTKVYAKQWETRYIKCRKCGWTFKVVGYDRSAIRRSLK